MVVLTTARMGVRPCSVADRADFIALEADPEVMRFLNGGVVEGPGDGSYLMPRGEDEHVWAAHLKDGSFVGWFCLWPDGGGVAELGYRLRRAVWGQGLAAEGAAALVAWGFESAGYERIYAGTMAVNLASRRVMEKIGMRHVRTVFGGFEAAIAGSEAGEVEYEVRRDG